MVNETEKYRISLFDGTNFDNWKFRMETLLRELKSGRKILHKRHQHRS